jgi:predicted DNA-binding transcriptional regulator YafY
MRDVKIGAAARPPDEGFDPVEHVLRSFARVPWTHECVVELSRPIEVPLGELDGNRLTMRVESLDYMARVLAGLDCDFTVISPPELNTSVDRLASRLARRARTPRSPD